MRGPPPEVMATWPPPNYDNPETRGSALLIVELTIMPIAVMTLLARLYVRLFMVRTGGLDDWLMVAAMVFGIGVTVCVILASQLYGWNIHVWDLTANQAMKGRQVSIAAQTLFLVASGLAKTSILTSYLRIAPKDSWFRRLTYVSIAIVISLMVTFMVVLWTQCRPMHAYWDLIGSDECSAEAPPLLGQSIAAVLTDSMVYILPLPTLIGLKLAIVQRIALIILFSLGFVVVFAGCMRTYWAHHVTADTYDVTWEGFELWIWTAVEANLGIICGCVPTLRPLFRTGDGTGARSSVAAGAGTVTGTYRKSGKSWTTSPPHARHDDDDDDDDDIQRCDYDIEACNCKSVDMSDPTMEMDSWPSDERKNELDYERPPEMAGPLSR